MKMDVASIEENIFSRWGVSPQQSIVNVRHCQCEIHTISVPAAEDQGNDPIVLIHGFGTGVAYWAPNILALSKHHTVHAFDLPGFGRSSRPLFSNDETLSELELVSIIEDWRKEMNIERAFVVAHSFGAFLASSYALEHPARVRHLLLVDPWGFPEKPILTEKQMVPLRWMLLVAQVLSYFTPLFVLRLANTYGALLLKKIRPDIKRRFANGDDVSDDIYKYVAGCNCREPTGEMLYKSLTNASGWAKRPMSRRFCGMDESVPSSFIYGSRSFVDPGPALDIQGSRDRVSVHVVRGAGHLVNVDCAALFNQLVEEIVESS